MLRRSGVFDELYDLFSEFDRLFRRTMRPYRELIGETALAPRALPSRSDVSFLPAMECFHRDNTLVLRAELPGVDPKDVEVSIVGNQVFLRGEKKQETRVEEKDLFFREFSQGRFERSFTLPEGTKTDQVKASFQNGVLEVTLPAGTAVKPRTIPIEIGGGGKSAKAA
jgi:HSP20 family protein